MYLRERWNLYYGEDSKIVLPSLRADLDPSAAASLEARHWKITSSMKCLGQILASNGSISRDFDNAIGSMWWAFFAGVKPGI